jgi:hypothetical protein
MKKKQTAVAVSAFVLLVILSARLLWFWKGPGDGKVFFDGMFGGVVGGLITAAVTLGLIWLGLEQVEDLAETASDQARTTEADFILRRTDSFFRAKTRRLCTYLRMATWSSSRRSRSEIRIS